MARWLPRSSLPVVHAVSTLFSELSRPLLFAEFVFHPPKTERRAKRERDEFQIAKLALWSSPEIAPLVRKCVVNFADIQECIVTDGLPEWEVSRRVSCSWISAALTNVEDFIFGDYYSQGLVLACLEAIPRFTNLEDLTCPSLVQITDTWRGPAAELVRVLRSCGRTAIHSVTSLLLTIHYHDIPAGSSLGDSLAFFPALETLRIFVYSGPRHAVPPMTDRALCARLGTILRPFHAPRTVMFDWGLNGDDSSERIPPLSMLTNVLREVISGFDGVVYEYFDAWPDFDKVRQRLSRINADV
ncbi:hypothetical protein C8R45DRAFT_1188557 [Mycena sanguinolenta]|nr:hypothetical protein C8R45DRAFT_1188557 [Mycena sanguinolenta]